MFENLRQDLDRYFFLGKIDGFFSKMKVIALTQGIWAIIVYRMGSWCANAKKNRPYLRVILPFFTVIEKLVEIMTGISLPFACRIGKGLYIGHFGSIILGHEVVIGEYCNLSHQVSIGQAGRGGIQKSPIIGNRVFIAPGAKLFGGIKIGDNVAIGANAVVTKDVPDNAVVVGIPGKVISHEGSKDFIIVRPKSHEDENPPHH